MRTDLGHGLDVGMVPIDIPSSGVVDLELLGVLQIPVSVQGAILVILDTHAPLAELGHGGWLDQKSNHEVLSAEPITTRKSR